MTSHRPSRAPQAPSLRGLAGLATAALVLAAGAGCAGANGVEGSLQGVRAGQDKAQPLTGGWVAVLTPEQASAFLAAAGTDQPAPEGLPYLNARVRHEGVTEAGGTLAAVDDDGGFSTAATGARVLCVLREVPDQADRLRGCVQLDLPERGKLELTLRADRLDSTLDG